VVIAAGVSSVLLHFLAPGTKRLETTRSQQQVLLSDADRDRLEDMLRGLTAERQAIAEVGQCVLVALTVSCWPAGDLGMHSCAVGV
jgi:hypothetical protein